jgi:hypothetical protein
VTAHSPLPESETDTVSAGGNVASLVPNPNREIELRHATFGLGRLQSSQQGFEGVTGSYAETAYHSTKFLLGLQVPDIIQLRKEATSRDRLQWYGLQG